MTTTAAAAALLLLSWAAACSGRAIAHDPRALVLSIAQNDRTWARFVDRNVKVDTARVTPAAVSVLRRLEVAVPEAPEARAGAAADETGGRSPRGRPAGDATASSATVVTVNALAVVAEVACTELYESDAFDFASAVAAAALKCAVLPYLLAQAEAIERSVDFYVAGNFGRPRAVWATVSRYLNKLARLGESLRTGSEMNRLIETAVRQTLPPSPTNEYGTLGDVKAFRALVHDAVLAGCGTAAVDAVHAQFDGGPEAWERPEDTAAVFERSQTELDGIMDGLPIKAMDEELWRDFVDGPRP